MENIYNFYPGITESLIINKVAPVWPDILYLRSNVNICILSQCFAMWLKYEYRQTSLIFKSACRCVKWAKMPADYFIKLHNSIKVSIDLMYRYYSLIIYFYKPIFVVFTTFIIYKPLFVILSP